MVGYRRVILVAALALALAIVACREPTSMHVVIATDVPCAQFRGLSLSIAKTALDAENAEPISFQRTCRGFVLGDIYIGPSSGSKDGDFYLHAAVGTDADVANCAAPSARASAGCIVQRRHLRFQPGVTLELTLNMPLRCVGITCTPTSTCARTQRCVPSDAECVTSGEERCTEADSVDAGGDGGGTDPTGDGGITDGSTGDSGRRTLPDGGTRPSFCTAGVTPCSGSDVCCYAPGAVPAIGEDRCVANEAACRTLGGSVLHCRVTGDCPMDTYCCWNETYLDDARCRPLSDPLCRVSQKGPLCALFYDSTCPPGTSCPLTADPHAFCL